MPIELHNVIIGMHEVSLQSSLRTEIKGRFDYTYSIQTLVKMMIETHV